jgi:hypothetical protein
VWNEIPDKQKYLYYEALAEEGDDKQEGQGLKEDVPYENSDDSSV